MLRLARVAHRPSLAGGRLKGEPIFSLPLAGRARVGVGRLVESLSSEALDHLSLRERSTRVSAAGEGLQVYPERAVPPHPRCARPLPTGER